MKRLAAIFAIIAMAAASHAYEIVQVEDGGSLGGKITYSGKKVKPKKTTVSKDQETCGHEPREMPRVISGPDGELAKAVVTLEGIEKGKAFPDNSEGQVLDQQHCEYHPYMQIIRTGVPLKVKNSDPILHNIQATQDQATIFNQAQPFQGLEFDNTIDKVGPVIIQCNAHSWMEAYLWATDHPYAAITDEDGKFSLTDIPPGDYTLVVWHPFLGEQATKVTIKAGEATQVDFDYTARLRQRQTK